jgi:CRISPR/Cas system-associated exonuclease Cas4 (RecB family)
MRISKSSLTTFIQCPEKYRLAYELKIKPIKKPSDLLIGSSTHYLIASFFIRNRAGQSCDLKELVGDYWSRYSLENTDFATMEELDGGMLQSLAYAKVFLAETNLKPTEVEYTFSLPVVNVVTGEILPDVELVGVIDLIDTPNGKRRAIEIKTKSKKPDAFAAATSVELTCYAYRLRSLNDQPACASHADRDVIPVAYANIIKTKKPYLQWQDQERSRRDFVDLFHTIETVADNIREARFYKNPGVHCNWCDYKPICSRDRAAVKERFGEELSQRLIKM